MRINWYPKKGIVKTNNSYTAYKCGKKFGESTGLPVRVVQTKRHKFVVVTDRILWENEGCPQYSINMPKSRAILGRRACWY